jgi:hypothetical protein
VFINYRRADAEATALAIYDRLAPRLGKENVFLDHEVLIGGDDWRKTINARIDSCGVMLALIGPNWLNALHDRSQQEALGEIEDVAREEIERALARDLDIEIVPLLLKDAPMLSPDDLPKSLRQLTEKHFEPLTIPTIEGDIDRILKELEQIADADRKNVAVRVKESETSKRPFEIDPQQPLRYREVAKCFLSSRDHMAVILGPDINTLSPPLPNANELAKNLAEDYGYPHLPKEDTSGDASKPAVSLPEVAQYIYATEDARELYGALQERLTIECQPGSVHTFLANLPKTIKKLGDHKEHPLILTTNYDTLLEKAFDDAGEPYDLAVYQASGETPTKFVHLSWQERDPFVIEKPNNYPDKRQGEPGFPFHDDWELRRTLIVKVYGAVGTREPGCSWDDENFVVTEDNYIDYLSGLSIEQLVPVQIRARLKDSHCLFLGYDISDWNLRVLMKRIWSSGIDRKSWAVQADPDDLQEQLWRQPSTAKVTLFSEPIDDYINGLKKCLSRDQ